MPFASPSRALGPAVFEDEGTTVDMQEPEDILFNTQEPEAMGTQPIPDFVEEGITVRTLIHIEHVTISPSSLMISFTSIDS